MVWTIIITVLGLILMAVGVYSCMDWHKKWTKSQELDWGAVEKSINTKFYVYPIGTKYEVVKSIEINDLNLNETLRLLPGAIITIQGHKFYRTIISFNISAICAKDAFIYTKDLDENCKKIN